MDKSLILHNLNTLKHSIREEFPDLSLDPESAQYDWIRSLEDTIAEVEEIEQISHSEN